MSTTESMRRMSKGGHDFVVENFSLCKGLGVGKSINSLEFPVGGCLWDIRFFPDGLNDATHERGYASLYLTLKSDPAAPIRCLVELRIVDQSGSGNHVGPSCISTNGSAAPNVPGCGLPFFSSRGVSWGSPNTIKRAKLGRLSSNYLKNDCLRISCTVAVLPSHIQNLLVEDDFGRLFETMEGADVFFQVGGVAFAAHKWIVAAHSPVFRSLLLNVTQHQQQELVIDLDMEPRVFQAMLRFIYTGAFEPEEEDIVGVSYPSILQSFMAKIVAAADKFELKRLKKTCELSFLERLSVESVVYILRLAELYHATELKAGCLKFAAENLSDVLESEGLEYLLEACPSLFSELVGSKKNMQLVNHSRAKAPGFWSRIFSCIEGALCVAFRLWSLDDVSWDMKKF